MMNLSYIEQSPRSRDIYTQLCFCYSISDGVSHSQLTETLTQGLERLTTSFPWLAGKVINKGAGAGSSGVFRIVPYKDMPLSRVKDLTHDDTMPTMDVLRSNEFPFSMLDENIICPRSTLLDHASETSEDTWPVLLLQINFINRGVLLTILASHITMDIVGQAQVIRLLSRACHNETFTDEELRTGNLDRRDLIPLLDDLDHTKINPSQQDKDKTPTQTNLNRDPPPTASPALTWAYLAFTPDSLTALKKSASSSLPEASTFISTDDAICALIWQATARARFPRLTPSTTLNFVRQVDVRTHMAIPQTYTGNMVTNTTNTLTLQDLVASSLGILASQLRSKLDRQSLVNSIRTHATIQALTNDKSAGPPKDRSGTVVMSSWSKVKCYDLDFNFGLGPPISVRRPRFAPVEGVMYLLPKAPDGEIVAGLCLREEDMERLKCDELFTRYGRYIG